LRVDGTVFVYALDNDLPALKGARPAAVGCTGPRVGSCSESRRLCLAVVENARNDGCEQLPGRALAGCRALLATPPISSSAGVPFFVLASGGWSTGASGLCE
jgi:hypothetical protein